MQKILQTYIRFEAFTVMKIHTVVFWVTSCHLEGGYQCSWEAQCLHLKEEDGSRRFFQNAGTHLSQYYIQNYYIKPIK
jgi:hypothetical protein